MTAGHNALRESGPGQKPAFDNALAEINLIWRLLKEFLSELSRKEGPRYKLRTERVQQEHALRLCRRGPDRGKNEHY
jgi:hypothetical protein